MVLETKHGYTRSVCSLNRMMRKLGIERKKQRKKKYIPKPYYILKISEEMFGQRGSYISLQQLMNAQEYDTE